MHEDPQSNRHGQTKAYKSLEGPHLMSSPLGLLGSQQILDKPRVTSHEDEG